MGYKTLIMVNNRNILSIYDYTVVADFNYIYLLALIQRGTFCKFKFTIMIAPSRLSQFKTQYAISGRQER